MTNFVFVGFKEVKSDDFNQEMVVMVHYVHSANLNILLFKLNTCSFLESFLETMLHVAREEVLWYGDPWWSDEASVFGSCGKSADLTTNRKRKSELNKVVMSEQLFHSRV